MKLDDLIQTASSNRPLSTADVEAVARHVGLAVPDVLDLFARTVAVRYLRGDCSYGSADMAMNQLFAFAHVDSGLGLPDLAWEVFGAFDEGEFARDGEPPQQHEARTRELLGRIGSLDGAQLAARPALSCEAGEIRNQMEQTPPFEQAVQQFGKFLAEQGWSSLIVWRHPADVVRRAGKDMVVRRRASRQATAWARRYYEVGHGKGLGISLSAECEIGGAVCATIFWTADDQEAQQLMMPTQGLKMSAALPRACGQSVSWLGWWLARKEMKAFHKALSAEDARYRSRNP